MSQRASRTAASVLTAVLVAAAAVTACGPRQRPQLPDDAAERYAEVFCDAFARCGCTTEALADHAACLVQGVETFEAAAAVPGVEVDTECFEEFLDWAAEAPCAAAGPSNHGPCSVFRGTVAAGEACMPTTDVLPRPDGLVAVGSCRGEAACVEGRCGDVSARPSEGERCSQSLGVGCGRDTYCNVDGVCSARKTEGMPCDTPDACTPIAEYCAGLTEKGETGVCTAKLAAGSPCDPAQFESCADGYCSTAGLCESAWPLVCDALAHPRDRHDPRDWIPYE